MQITNPNVTAELRADRERKPEPPAKAKRTELRAIIDSRIKAWPATYPEAHERAGDLWDPITTHDVVVSLRSDPPAGWDPANITGETVDELLAELSAK